MTHYLRIDSASAKLCVAKLPDQPPIVSVIGTPGAEPGIIALFRVRLQDITAGLCAYSQIARLAQCLDYL